MTSGRPWYEVAFGDLYSLLYSHRDEGAAAKEVAFVVRTLEIDPSESVLDLGCGSGRHLRALSQRGLKPVGMDLSPQLLAEGRRSGCPDLVRGDMRRLPFATRAFDVVLSFFTSFGYFDTDAEDRRVVEEVARVLRPGGRYLLDYLDAGTVASRLVPRSEKVLERHRIVEERRIEDGRVKKKVMITPLSGGDTIVYEESVRLYGPDELQALAASVGLETRAIFGSLDGAPPSSADRTVLVTVRES